MQTRPEREYLLKGIICCAYCGMRPWSQTYHSGIRVIKNRSSGFKPENPSVFMVETGEG
jgi:hypothetical protein